MSTTNHHRSVSSLRRAIAKSVVLAMLSMAAVACRSEPASPDDVDDPVHTNPDWTDATHGKVTPNYSTVLPQTSVNTIEITMTASTWTALRADMKALFGYEFGSNSSQMGFPAGEPAYFPVTLKFNGKTWQNVGYRLKGNSSLSSAWKGGNYKLPFRLQFDEFEDSDPAIADQRFYGFKEVSMSPGFKDPSLIREKLASDVFRLAGIPAARTAFYRVYLDTGTGLKYCGVYTMVEVVDNTMIKDQFGEDAGNIYKPISSFLVYSEQLFEKKNNSTAGDFSDVQAMTSALNSPLRTADAAQWRTNLEAVFDVDHFLKWLAVNNAIVNWDTYGKMAHNYYLYHKTGGRLTWIPWDNNEAFTGSPGVTGGGQGNPGAPLGLSLTMNEVNASWPLLRLLVDDPVYNTAYRNHLRSFAAGVLSGTAIENMADAYTALVSQYVIGVNGEQAGYSWLASPASFTAALPALKTHLQNRRALIAGFVP